MKPLFKPETIRVLIMMLSLMLLVKLGWFVVEMTLLSAEGVNYAKSSQAKSLYYRTRFAAQKLKQKHIVKAKPVSDINSFELLAIYHSPSRVVVTVSKKGKSSVLTKGDEIDGYRLEDATAQEAIFLRDGKSYRIRLTESSKQKMGSSSVRYIDSKEKKIPEEKSDDKGEIVQDESVTVLDRSLLEHYQKNINDIWKNIGITDVKEGEKIKGFKVNFIKRGSDFAKLGLRRGDVIKSINGQEIHDYKSAFDSYKNIDTMDGLSLTIQRGEEEMELEYEIN